MWQNVSQKPVDFERGVDALRRLDEPVHVDREVRGAGRGLVGVEHRVQVLLELRRILIALLGILRERLEDDLIHALRDLDAAGRGRRSLT